MKKIIMFSGIDNEKGFTLEQTKELTRIIETGKSIAFIASSFYDFEKNDYFINGLIGFFKDISIRFNKISIIDNRISKEEARDIVENSDIVFIVGGDPKKEMDSINEYGLSNILRDRDGITIGVSAGSINMAKDAREEGFDEIAVKMEQVAAIEKTHEERYRQLIANIEKNEVFAKKEEKVWVCRNCGYVHTGKTAPEVCPVCAHPKAYFMLKEENY